MNGELSEYEMEHGCWPKLPADPLPLFDYMIEITTAEGTVQYHRQAPGSIDAVLVGIAERFPGCIDGILPKEDMKVSVTRIEGAKA